MTTGAQSLAVSAPPGAAPDHCKLARAGCDFLHLFQAMATPCEVRIETDDILEASRAALAVEAEARRIEQKFSRYRDDSVIGQINSGGGRTVTVDRETALLIDYAAHVYDVSDGLFDITSGVLRRIWKFDGSDRVPADEDVRRLRQLVGWRKVQWHTPDFTLRPGMEIDLGGLGKEYAVDCALKVAMAQTRAPLLVNFGGDLRCSGIRESGEHWKVAIESVDRPGTAAAILEIGEGAIATSGDARRFLLKNGVRYSHILDPRTCKPVFDPPRSVTVAGRTCLEAGMLATLAMLQGRNAEKFLAREAVRSWCIRA